MAPVSPILAGQLFKAVAHELLAHLTTRKCGDAALEGIKKAAAGFSLPYITLCLTITISYGHNTHPAAADTDARPANSNLKTRNLKLFKAGNRGVFRLSARLTSHL